MGRSATSLAVAGLLVAGLGAAGCGLTQVPNAGQSASVNLSLTTVPTVRSVTVSPANASFGNCIGGMASSDTKSTPGRLGFPNGRCFVGLVAPGFYPITITNTGIASDILVNGSSASPSDGGKEWALCTRHLGGGAICTQDFGRLPGTDQYMIENFSSVGQQMAGISATPACDVEFDASGRCWAVQGASVGEGIELIGPAVSTDTSTKWTITITWTPVPSQG